MSPPPAKPEDNPALGATPQERSAAVGRLRLIARIGTATGVAIAIWGAFWPTPRNAVIAALAAVPVAALVLTLWKPRAYSLHENAPGGRITLIYMHFFAIAILGVRTFLGVHILDWQLLAGIVALGGAVIAFAITRLESDLVPSWRNMPTLFLGGALFVYGATAQADMLLDRGARATYATAVIDKITLTGRRGTFYQLKLAPWGPTQLSGDFDVPSEFYERTYTGQTVCAFVGSGALGLRWYEIGNCP